jgi:hypothetical protein
MMKKIYKILPAIIITFFIAVHVNAAQEFVGSKTSNKYHYPTCKWVKEIKPQNLIQFDSPEQATKAGYIPCPTCHPPVPEPEKKTENTIPSSSAKQSPAPTPSLTPEPAPALTPAPAQAPVSNTTARPDAKQRPAPAPAKPFSFNIIWGFLLLLFLYFVPFLPGLFEIMIENVHLPRIKMKKGLTK